MADLTCIHDKKLAVIFIEDDGSANGKWTALFGMAKWRNGHLSAHRGMDIPEFPIPDDTLDRVKPVPPATRDILEGADYYITLKIGPMPEGADPGEFLHTGLRLPGGEKTP